MNSERRVQILSREDLWLGENDTAGNFTTRIPEIRNVKSIRFVNAVIPIGHSNIFLGRDSFMATNGIEKKITLANGQYASMDAVVEEINNRLAVELAHVHCDIDENRLRIFFFTDNDSEFTVKFETSDLYKILGFKHDHTYESSAAEVNGDHYEECIIAPHTYDHWGGIHTLFLCIDEPDLEKAFTFNDPKLSELNVVGIIPVNYSESVASYTDQNPENAVQVHLVGDSRTISILSISFWAYSGAYNGWFQMTFEGVNGLTVDLGFEIDD